MVPKRAPVYKTPVKKAPALTLAQQAQQLAKATVAQQVQLIQQQQDLANQQAAARGAQLNAASQGAAQYFQSLPNNTYGNYKDAATTLAGLAGGFTGNLRDLATGQANQVQSDLAAAGSPQTASNQGGNIANAIYGMSGTQPASSLLQAGAAAATRGAAVPIEFASHGQDLLSSALAAGRDQAAQYQPQILDAEGKLPTLANQYLNQFQTQAINARKLKDAEIGLNSLITSRANNTTIANNRLLLQQRQDTVKQNNWIASFNAKVTAANNKRSDAQAKLALANPSQSRLHGYLTDGNGNPILRNGRLQPIVGYRIAPNGQTAVKIAKAGSGTTPSGSKPLSLSSLNSLVKSWYTGASTSTPTTTIVRKNGKPIPLLNPDGTPQVGPDGKPLYETRTSNVSGKQPVNYQRAYNLLLPHLTGTKVQRDAQARQLLDTYYQKGQFGRGWLTNEQQQALKKLGRFAPARMFQGHGYITMYQADGLNQAGMLPAGAQGVVNGKPVYYINPKG
jgi:hypothetical protein